MTGYQGDFEPMPVEDWQRVGYLLGQIDEIKQTKGLDKPEEPDRVLVPASEYYRRLGVYMHRFSMDLLWRTEAGSPEAQFILDIIPRMLRTPKPPFWEEQPITKPM